MKLEFSNVTAPSISCETQRLDTRTIVWPLRTSTFVHHGVSFSIAPIDGGDIDDVVDLYRRYYPHLYRSERHGLLDREFYETQVAWRSRWEVDAAAKEYLMGLIRRVDTGEAIFAFGLRRDRYDVVLQGIAIVMKPDYRGSFITHHYVEYLDEIVIKSGADYMFGTAQVKDVIAQRVALRGGFRLGGIMPGAFRWSYDGQTYYRDMLLYMYRFLNGSERYSTQPCDWRLTDKLKDAHLRLYDIAETDLDAGGEL